MESYGIPRGERKKNKEDKENKDRERKRERERGNLKSSFFFLFRFSEDSLSPLSWTRRRNFGWERFVGRRMQVFDRMTIPMRRVWTGVATRLGVRKSGLLKLRKDVRSCEYEDVQVMWEMLRRNETEVRSPRIWKKRPLSCFGWARCAPFLCRSF
ncbi:uncharacterized protein LOC111276768 [Durio zibethinus]|uniref:Uncharacterized protein LOC111276768 n=1 Tax=Durio zibethinus TaxID=66656 RepID=A0A6P5WQM7_DURZI|nr:uncharacterized protein LOC111276768 [Durio zibethinus]